MSGFCEQPFQRSSAWGRDNLAILGHFSFKWNPSLTKIIKENIFQLWSIGDILPGAVANAPSDGNSWALVIQTICVDFVLKKKFYYWTEHGTWKYMFYEALVKQSWLEISVRRLLKVTVTWVVGNMMAPERAAAFNRPKPELSPPSPSAHGWAAFFIRRAGYEIGQNVSPSRMQRSMLGKLS